MKRASSRVRARNRAPVAKAAGAFVCLAPAQVRLLARDAAEDDTLMPDPAARSNRLVRCSWLHGAASVTSEPGRKTAELRGPDHPWTRVELRPVFWEEGRMSPPETDAGA